MGRFEAAMTEKRGPRLQWRLDIYRRLRLQGVGTYLGAPIDKEDSDPST